MLDAAGFARGVLVHSSANGYDNSGTADALAAAAGRLTGVCVIQPDISDAALEKLHHDGFRAVRFTETGARAAAHAGSASLKDMEALAPRMRALGWQAHLWANCAFTVAEAQRLHAAGLRVALDHMGYFDASLGVRHETFQSLLALLRDSDFWVKLSVVRVSKERPDYANIRPFHDALIEAIPDRLIFGSDWPYISLDDAPPDVGRLIDLFDAWTPDKAIRQKVFVDNPARLFG
jgi:2-pyrone-4,6-dicarboxylate lactonase